MSLNIQSTGAALALALSLVATAAVAAPAMRVVQDPVTGELRAPNAAEAAAFEKAEAQLRASRAAKGKGTDPKVGVEIRHADGSVETPLGEDSMMFSVVKANEDGTLAMECLPAAQAKKFVQSSKKSSTAKVNGKADHAHQ